MYSVNTSSYSVLHPPSSVLHILPGTVLSQRGLQYHTAPLSALMQLADALEEPYFFRGQSDTPCGSSLECVVYSGVHTIYRSQFDVDQQTR